MPLGTLNFSAANDFTICVILCYSALAACALKNHGNAGQEGPMSPPVSSSCQQIATIRYFLYFHQNDSSLENEGVKYLERKGHLEENVFQLKCQALGKQL